MDNEQIAAWEDAARKVAVDALSALDRQAPTDFGTLVAIEQAEANGTNSLDPAFMDSIIAGEHLTDHFLANAYKN